MQALHDEGLAILYGDNIMYLAEAGHIQPHLSRLSATTRSCIKHIFIRYGMFQDQLKRSGPELVVLATMSNLRRLNYFKFRFINTPHPFIEERIHDHENVCDVQSQKKWNWT